jgi:galactose mutarotase-like enzyme
MPSKRPPGPYSDPPRPASPIVEIRSGDARAAFATRGAEPVAWSVGGVDLLWDGDETWWPKSSPVLFPLCGQTKHGAIKVGDVSYPIPIHGFSPTTVYTLAGRGDDWVRWVLRDSAQTRAAFPVAFSLTVEYRLSATGLAAAFTVHNPGGAPMPYAIGFHPGFNWPFSGGERDGHAIVFEKPETPMVPEANSSGLFKHATRPVPLEGRRMQLHDGVIAGQALCFFDVKSRSVRFENGAGGAIVVEAENFPHFAIWAKANAPYLCIESWTGYADPEDFDGELADKPSMRFLAPGGTANHAVTLRYEAPGKI